ncbi:hypothetical protein ACFPOI_43745 [Nonomuraea angiospora]|uniref:Uncharacterized protein n=1 Tax=Nonomuraea angiospora TaxID=46172 RepID=A0ABR9LPR8_9ACTN|nr:hypothetical protein [Nonomuraea angiospora]MBE1582295.1 hypothetical protein [Nonomuraea angiospora]
MIASVEPAGIVGRVGAIEQQCDRKATDVTARTRLEQLGLLLAAGLTNIQARELFEAAAGFKMSRINLFDHELPAVIKFCDEQRLSYELSDYRVLEFMSEEGKGHFSNMGTRTDDPAGLRYCYVSRDPEESRRGKEAERAEDFGPWEMGELLRVPKCCTDFFVRNKQEAIDRYSDDYALITSRETGSPGPFDFRLNYQAQYFGYSLFTYFLCNWRCEESIRRSEAILEIVGDVSPSWRRTFERNLASVIVYENLVAVHRVHGEFVGGRELAFYPHDLRSTSSTPLREFLLRERRLRWEQDGSLRFTAGGGAALLAADETRVIPFTAETSSADV